MESVGYYPLSMAAARNKYERMEKGLDWAFWMTIGVAMPFLLESIFSRAVSNNIRRHFKLPQASAKLMREQSLLHIPFEWVEKTGSLLHDKTGALKADDLKNIQRLSTQLGFKNPNDLKDLLTHNEAFKGSIRRAKVAIMWADLGLMAMKGQLYSWSKNWITEKLSGKKGFSGEFNYTDDKFREGKSENYYKTKSLRQKLSVLVGFSGALFFPAIVARSLVSPSNEAVFGGVKKLLRHFNYTDAIFLPKAVFLVHTLFNYNLPTLMASRDNHEFRENLSKCLAFDFFYYLGDEMLTGQVAKLLQKRMKLSPAISEVKQGFLGLRFPHNKRLSEVFNQLKTTTPNVTNHPTYKAANWSFWSGLLGSGFGLGLTMPLLNNYFTQKAVNKEQKIALPPPITISSATAQPLKQDVSIQPGIAPALSTDATLAPSVSISSRQTIKPVMAIEPLPVSSLGVSPTLSQWTPNTAIGFTPHSPQTLSPITTSQSWVTFNPSVPNINLPSYEEPVPIAWQTQTLTSAAS